ncbi:MAG: hypothetical protein ACRC46_13040 [Thermoguttaceae bacterium]
MLRIFLAFGLVASLVLTGCSSKYIDTEAVTGTVTLDGVPLVDASVSFSPKVDGQGTPGAAVTDTAGKYILQTPQGAANAGTSAGEYVVRITKTEQKVTGKYKDNYSGEMREMTQPENILPAIYGDTSKTPFSATVEKGKPNVFDFDLKSK